MEMKQTKIKTVERLIFRIIINLKPTAHGAYCQ